MLLLLLCPKLGSPRTLAQAVAAYGKGRDLGQLTVSRTWQALRCSVSHLSTVAYGLSLFPMTFPLGMASGGHLDS